MFVLSTYDIYILLLQDLGGQLIGPDCDQQPYKPNVFLMSLILFIGTFLISVVLKDFKNARFFPTKVCTFCLEILKDYFNISCRH